MNRSADWDAVVRSFSEYDVYYLSGYVKGFQIHGDGEPYLLYYESEGLRAMYAFMLRRTSLEGYYDCVSPYGYGGVLFEGDIQDARLHDFWDEYVSFMQERHIVDNFVRYHPILGNAAPMREISTVVDLGRTIAMDLTSPEVIWENLTSKNRNMIRKAQKCGITIHHGKDPALLDDFKQIYDATMDHDHASAYYYFSPGFYQSLVTDLHDHFEVFYAVHEEKIVAISIMLYANGQMHYHLSGSLYEYRNLAPANLMLYEAALWGHEMGLRTFHMGGGLGSEEDGLYKFKAAFNKNATYQFSIGKQVFDSETYDRLVAMRAQSDPTFDAGSRFFPLYRS